MPAIQTEATATLKAMREEQATLSKEIRRLADLANNEGRDFTSEEKETWDKVNTRYDFLAKQVEIAQRAATIEAQSVQHAGDPLVGRGDYNGRLSQRRASQEITEEHRALALQGWCRYQLGHPLEEAHEEACQITGLVKERKALDIKLLDTAWHGRLQDAVANSNAASQRAVGNSFDFRAALSGVTGASGAYTIPPETLIRQLELNMLWFGGMRQVAEVMRTATGERISWPTADDTTNTGAILSENASIGTSVDPSFAKVYWDAYKFSSKPILVPFELLQDSAFSLVTVLGQMLGERLGRITNTYYTTGTGAAVPRGIVTAATLGKTAASATAITADEIIDLVHSVDIAYRNGARFMMHDTILAAMRKLKDGSGQYLWVPSVLQGIQPGVPDLLFGAPYTINNDMASSIATTNKTVLFGQLSKYKIRTVGSVRFYRLEERYRDSDQDGFLAFLREDGNLLTAGQAPVKYLQQA